MMSLLDNKVSSSSLSKYAFTYDVLGNITELTDNAGSTVATYRYTAFGDVWSSSGSAASENQYRFSTKPLDEEVLRSSSGAFNAGLYYYGFRYYDPVTGRWPSRDPIGERGGLNLYGMVGNDAVNQWDLLGLKVEPFLFVSYFTESCVPVASISLQAPSRIWSYVSTLVSTASFIQGLIGTNYRTDTQEISVPDCYILEKDPATGSAREEVTYDLLDWRISFDGMPWGIDVCGNVVETIEWFWIPDPDDECCK